MVHRFLLVPRLALELLIVEAFKAGEPLFRGNASRRRWQIGRRTESALGASTAPRVRHACRIKERESFCGRLGVKGRGR